MAKKDKSDIFKEYEFNPANPLMIGVAGKGNQGKSYSLKPLVEDMGDRIGYINTDRKPLSFHPGKLRLTAPNTPDKILAAIRYINSNDDIEIGVLDTLTHAMDIFKIKVVDKSSDTRKAWGAYGDFYYEMMDELKSASKPWIIFFHEHIYEDDAGNEIHSVPVQGRVSNKGVETDFTTILTATTVTPKTIKKFIKKNPNNKFLSLSKRESASGVKRIFLTRNDKNSLRGLSRSQDDLWDYEKPSDHLYINNDMKAVIQHLINYQKGNK